VGADRQPVHRNALLLLINLPLAPAWARLLQIPRPYLYAGILFFATLGAYSVNLQAFDLGLLLLLGLLGFAMRRYGLPVLPLVVGLILGPRAEEQLRKSLQLSSGEVSGLWSEPVAVVVYVVIALILVWPLLVRMLRRGGTDAGGGDSGLGGTARTDESVAVPTSTQTGPPATGRPAEQKLFISTTEVRS
jgi:putative tricarboxylic transport membrane protein